MEQNRETAMKRECERKMKMNRLSKCDGQIHTDEREKESENNVEEEKYYNKTE